MTNYKLLFHIHRWNIWRRINLAANVRMQSWEITWSVDAWGMKQTYWFLSRRYLNSDSKRRAFRSVIKCKWPFSRCDLKSIDFCLIEGRGASISKWHLTDSPGSATQPTAQQRLRDSSDSATQLHACWKLRNFIDSGVHTLRTLGSLSKGRNRQNWTKIWNEKFLVLYKLLKYINNTIIF